jgi:hypothetical protein
MISCSVDRNEYCESVSFSNVLNLVFDLMFCFSGLVAMFKVFIVVCMLVCLGLE